MVRYDVNLPHARCVANKANEHAHYVATGKLGHLDTSRREAAMGKEALQALTKLRVLVIGCRGAGIEAAKNVVLLGPKSICVWDPHPAKIEDLGCNFYLNENDVKAKTPRATACEPELVDLNPFSKVTTRADSFADVFKDVRGKQYTIVIVTDLLCLTKKELFDLSEVCHALGVVFLMALASGVTAALFSDFGPNHVITDIDGVPTNVCAVASLERITLTKNDEKGWLKPDTSHKEGRKAVIITVSCELKKELENGKFSSHFLSTLLCTPPCDQKNQTNNQQTTDSHIARQGPPSLPMIGTPARHLNSATSRAVSPRSTTPKASPSPECSAA